MLFQSQQYRSKQIRKMSQRKRIESNLTQHEISKYNHDGKERLKIEKRGLFIHTLELLRVW